MVFLLLSGEIDNIIVVEVSDAIVNLTVRCLDETEVVDLCIHTE